VATKRKPSPGPRISELPNTYKQWCDNHTDRRAAYAFDEAATGKKRGLCNECFDAERITALKALARQKRRARIKKARTRKV
jgi:hypothetical protein